MTIFLYDNSSLKKLAEKGVWEIAEARANGDGQLLEYLVCNLGTRCLSNSMDTCCLPHLVEIQIPLFCTHMLLKSFQILT